MPPPNPPTPTQRRPARNEDPFSTHPDATHNHDYSRLPFYDTREGQLVHHPNYHPGQGSAPKKKPPLPLGYARTWKKTPPWRFQWAFRKKYECCVCDNGTPVRRTAHNPDQAGRCSRGGCHHKRCPKCPVICEEWWEKVLEKAKKGKKRLYN